MQAFTLSRCLVNEGADLQVRMGALTVYMKPHRAPLINQTAPPFPIRCPGVYVVAANGARRGGPGRAVLSYRTANVAISYGQAYGPTAALHRSLSFCCAAFCRPRAVANVPAPNHAELLSRLALGFVAVVPEITSRYHEAGDLKLKVGVHSGAVIGAPGGRERASSVA